MKRGMDLPCQGSSREDENCSVQENWIDVLNCPVKNIIRGNLKILYANADGLPNKLNELKVLASVVTTIELSPPPRWLATTEPTPPPRCLAVFSAVYLGAVCLKLLLSILQSSVQR